jgi:hypothetical protein
MHADQPFGREYMITNGPKTFPRHFNDPAIYASGYEYIFGRSKRNTYIIKNNDLEKY